MRVDASGCTKCRTALPPDASFCHKCGAATPTSIDGATLESKALAPSGIDSSARLTALQAALGDSCEVRHEGAVVSGQFDVVMHSLSGKSSNPPERSAGTNYRWTSNCLSYSYLSH